MGKIVGSPQIIILNTKQQLTWKITNPLTSITDLNLSMISWGVLGLAVLLNISPTLLMIG